MYYWGKCTSRVSMWTVFKCFYPLNTDKVKNVILTHNTDVQIVNKLCNYLFLKFVHKTFLKY